MFSFLFNFSDSSSMFTHAAAGLLQTNITRHFWSEHVDLLLRVLYTVHRNKNHKALSGTLKGQLKGLHWRKIQDWWKI